MSDSYFQLGQIFRVQHAASLGALESSNRDHCRGEWKVFLACGLQDQDLAGRGVWECTGRALDSPTLVETSGDWAAPAV